MTTRAKIALTLGDPAGIGPEIVNRTLQTLAPKLRARLQIFAHRALITEKFADAVIAPAGEIVFVAGQPNEDTDRAQVDYLAMAVAAAQRGEVGAIVTAPIHKQAVARAGFAFPGHTEYLADAFGIDEFAMMFSAKDLHVVLATIHEPLAAVPTLLTTELVVSKIKLLRSALQRRLGIASPRIGVLGLNPHAGEGGQIGREEQQVIAPAIAACDWHDTIVRGPLVPDAAFRMARDGAFDGLVAMYHDQALIPLKLIAFEQCVNVTLGLPIIRCSPDHGVAYDIAGQNIASEKSLVAAVELAARLLDSAPAG